MKDKNVMSLTGAKSVSVFVSAAEFFLAVRFVLHFFAVNPANGFAAWVFNSTDALVTPFRNVFIAMVNGHPHYVDLQTLFIMAVYVVVGALLMMLFGWASMDREATLKK